MRRKLPPKSVPPDEPDPAHQVKGMISFPCCPKESVMVYADAHGRVSNKCPKCGRFAVFDYDEMCAEPGYDEKMLEIASDRHAPAFLFHPYKGISHCCQSDRPGRRASDLRPG